MWGQLWRIEALVEGGQLAAAAEQLSASRVAVERVGGPVSAWHLDRATACISQAQGRYVDAASAGRRAFDKMRAVEPAPAAGSYFELQRALAQRQGDGVRAAPVRRAAAIHDDGLDRARPPLAVAAEQAPRAGAPGFVAAAQYHLAMALLARNGPGDRDRAESAARDADRLARALGMTAYVDRTGALVAYLNSQKPAVLSHVRPRSLVWSPRA